MRIKLRREPRPRLEWMSRLAKTPAEARNTDEVPRALWVKKRSTHLAHGAEQAHPHVKSVTSPLQGLPLMKMR